MFEPRLGEGGRWRKERPGLAFVALRAAALGIDDISRQALRAWLMDTLDHRGQVVEEKPEPTEAASRTIVAALLTLTDAERAAYRTWMQRWTDFSGRIITPQEHERRLEAIRANRDPNAIPHSRGKNGGKRS